MEHIFAKGEEAVLIGNQLARTVLALFTDPGAGKQSPGEYVLPSGTMIKFKSPNTAVIVSGPKKLSPKAVGLILRLFPPSFYDYGFRSTSGVNVLGNFPKK